MKYLPIVLGALAAAGCSTDFATKPEFDDQVQKHEKLRAESQNRFDLMLMHHTELNAKHKELLEKVTELDGKMKLIEHALARLEDQLKSALAANPPKPANGEPEKPATAEARLAKAEDVLLEAEKNLTLLRSGKVKPEDVVAALKPYARLSTPRLVEELGKAVTNVDYTKQLEQILAHFPPSELKVALQRALQNRATRDSAARIVGNTKDRELSGILEEHVGTSDQDFVLALGEALVRCRNGAGLPLLIRCLASPESANRTIALDALRRVNGGKDFGYRAALGVDENAAAIKSWEEWHAKFGKVIFDNP